MIKVNSSAITAIGYDSRNLHMQIEFDQGDIYSFCNVPETVYISFLESHSKGSYYNRYIKNRYIC